jgi:hypothetical protein
LAQSRSSPRDPVRVETVEPVIPWFADEPFGGFGMDAAQPLVAGSFIMDQYGILHQVPGIVPTPETAKTAASPSRITRVRPSSDSRHRRYRLTTGSLDLGAGNGNGAILYSPAGRAQIYGSGYGLGPYGAIDNGQMWKGWPMD